MYTSHMAQPNNAATTTVATVIRNGMIRMGRFAGSRASGSSDGSVTGSPGALSAGARASGTSDAAMLRLSAASLRFDVISITGMTGHLATMRIQDERTMMYVANVNRAGCQTYRSKPKRLAIRRSAMVMSQAPTNMSEMGAT